MKFSKILEALWWQNSAWGLLFSPSVSNLLFPLAAACLCCLSSSTVSPGVNSSEAWESQEGWRKNKGKGEMNFGEAEEGLPSCE